jgi:hypothetical protein
MFYCSDLKEKLEINGYLIDDAEGNLDFIETEKQIIFICTGSANDDINRQIMNAVQYKMNKVTKSIFSIVLHEYLYLLSMGFYGMFSF